MSRSPTDLLDEYLRRELGLGADADGDSVVAALRGRFPRDAGGDVSGEAHGPVSPASAPGAGEVTDGAALALRELRERYPRAILERFRGLVPRVGRRAMLAPGAVLAGDVQLDDDVSIWFGAVLRADIAPILVGARSNLQDGVVAHVATGKPCVVGADVVVGHRAVLHACHIEDGCLIGMSATVLDDVVIGHGSVVGAGALVTERTIVPPNSLVLGMPAKVVRIMGPAIEDKNRALAHKYVGIKDDYLRS